MNQKLGLLLKSRVYLDIRDNKSRCKSIAKLKRKKSSRSQPGRPPSSSTKHNSCRQKFTKEALRFLTVPLLINLVLFSSMVNVCFCFNQYQRSMQILAPQPPKWNTNLPNRQVSVFPPPSSSQLMPSLGHHMMMNQISSSENSSPLKFQQNVWNEHIKSRSSSMPSLNRRIQQTVSDQLPFTADQEDFLNDQNEQFELQPGSPVLPISSPPTQQLAPVAITILQSLINGTQARHSHLKSAIEATRNFLKQQLPITNNQSLFGYQATEASVTSNPALQIVGQDSLRMINTDLDSDNRSPMSFESVLTPPRTLRQLLTSNNSSNVNNPSSNRFYNLLVPSQQVSGVNYLATSGNVRSTIDDKSTPVRAATKDETLEQSSSMIVSSNQTFNDFIDQRRLTRESEEPRLSSINLSAPYERLQTYGGKSVPSESNNNNNNQSNTSSRSISLMTAASGHNLSSISSPHDNDEDENNNNKSREQTQEQEMVLISATDNQTSSGNDNQQSEMKSDSNNESHETNHFGHQWNGSIPYEFNGRRPEEMDESALLGQQKAEKFYLWPSEQHSATGSQQDQQQYLFGSTTQIGEAQLDAASMFQLATEDQLSDHEPSKQSSNGRANTESGFFMIPASSYEQNNEHQQQEQTLNETAINADSESQDPSVTVQLPSQYDAVLRMPPEGHYDDYFKLSGGQGNEQASSLMDTQVHNFSLDNQQQQQQQQQFTLSPISDTQQHHKTTANASQVRNQQHVDYTMQYYMQQPNNKQPAEIQSDQREQSVEFIPAIIGGSSEKNLTIADERQKTAARHQTGLGNDHDLGEFNLDMFGKGSQNREKSKGDQIDYSAGDDVELFIRSNKSHSMENNNNEGKDSIQVIVANSTPINSQNPISEKLIHYTSEGKNFTRSSGKPARHNFVNKDLNELPIEEKTLNDNSTNNIQQTYKSSANTSRAPQLFAARFRHEASLGEQSRTQLADKLVAARSTRPPKIILQPAMIHSKQPSEILNNLSDQLNEYHEDEAAIGEQPENEVASRGQFGDYRTDGQKRNPTYDRSSSEQDNPIDRSGGPVAAVNKNNNLVRRPTKTMNSNSNNQPAQQDNSNKNGLYQQRPARPTHHHQHLARHHRHHQRPLATRRPQVTEAKFSLKDLALNAPTPMPTLAESAINSISEVPIKAKRLKEHQADKQELMNELLTALDRVKSAIYKLQPLTAKMNAIYRKSVTSNTRDIIMDHHKGTYAKRYPPGDYDDTYDRIYSRDLVNEPARSSSPRNSKSASSSKRRRASGNRSSNSTVEFRSKKVKDDGNDDQKTSGSAEAAVYVPAPSELLERMKARNSSGNSGTKGSNEWTKRMGEIDPFEGLHLVATTTPTPVIFQASGVGRRTSETIEHHKEDEVFYDEDEESIKPTSKSNPMLKRTSESNGQTRAANVSGSPENDDGPLFGYRITIYQAPEDGQDENFYETSNESSPIDSPKADKQLLSYRLFGSIGSDDAEGELTLATSSASINSSEQPQLDLMATSESSLAPTQSDGYVPRTRSRQENGDEAEENYEYPFDKDLDEEKDEGESRKSETHSKKHEKKQDKQSEEEEKHKKQAKKAKGEKKGEKKNMQQEKGKKGEEEHKKKKEFKKIKHHKGVMSKESHKLHRDKHIKAHDRGAAKEKALKERTQIEFFEREQIVDDEFEKGKKSSVKAGWASGHDAKRTQIKGHGGEGQFVMEPLAAASELTTATMANTNNDGVKPSPVGEKKPTIMMMAAASDHHLMGSESALDKSYGHSMETSSGKQSNKFEKKHLETKGKKFKGWREKGYKIITETEFIDRGSLHDSAYKKRDKGAAHHQKFKKHEAKSEGHHGSMHEHHKKMHKQAEKKHKSEEKKKETMDKEEGKKAKKHKKGEKKKSDEKKSSKEQESSDGHDYHGDESAPSKSSISLVPNGSIESELAQKNATDRSRHKQMDSFMHSSTLRPSLVAPQEISTKQPSISSTSPTRLSKMDDQDRKQQPPNFDPKSPIVNTMNGFGQQKSDGTRQANDFRFQYNLTPISTIQNGVPSIETNKGNSDKVTMTITKDEPAERRSDLQPDKISSSSNSTSVAKLIRSNEQRSIKLVEQERASSSMSSIRDREVKAQQDGLAQQSQSVTSDYKNIQAQPNPTNTHMIETREVASQPMRDLTSQLNLVRLALEHLNHNRKQQQQQTEAVQQQEPATTFQQILMHKQAHLGPPQPVLAPLLSPNHQNNIDQLQLLSLMAQQPYRQAKPEESMFLANQASNVGPFVSGGLPQARLTSLDHVSMSPSEPSFGARDSPFQFIEEQPLEELDYHDRHRHQQSIDRLIMKAPTETSSKSPVNTQHFLYPSPFGSMLDE